MNAGLFLIICIAGLSTILWGIVLLAVMIDDN